MRRVALHGVLALSVLLCVRCGGQSTSSDTETDAGGDAASDSTVGTGAIGLADVGGGGNVGVKQCEWPVAPAPNAGTGWLEAWCTGSGVNPPGCPSQGPKPGSACAVDGLACAFAGDEGFSVATCDGSWHSVGHSCSDACPLPPNGDPGIDLPAAACGSLGDAACAGDSTMTNVERLRKTLAAIAQCCGKFDEGIITVIFEDGCARTVFPGTSPRQVSECFAATLARRRLWCALGQQCASIEWSTVR